MVNGKSAKSSKLVPVRRSKLEALQKKASTPAVSNSTASARATRRKQTQAVYAQRPTRSSGALPVVTPAMGARTSQLAATRANSALTMGAVGMSSNLLGDPNVAKLVDGKAKRPFADAPTVQIGDRFYTVIVIKKSLKGNMSQLVQLTGGTFSGFESFDGPMVVPNGVNASTDFINQLLGVNISGALLLLYRDTQFQFQPNSGERFAFSPPINSGENVIPFFRPSPDTESNAYGYNVKGESSLDVSLTLTTEQASQSYTSYHYLFNESSGEWTVINGNNSGAATSGAGSEQIYSFAGQTLDVSNADYYFPVFELTGGSKSPIFNVSHVLAYSDSHYAYQTLDGVGYRPFKSYQRRDAGVVLKPVGQLRHYEGIVAALVTPFRTLSQLGTDPEALFQGIQRNPAPATRKYIGNSSHGACVILPPSLSDGRSLQEHEDPQDGMIGIIVARARSADMPFAVSSTVSFDYTVGDTISTKAMVFQTSKEAVRKAIFLCAQMPMAMSNPGHFQTIARGIVAVGNAYWRNRDFFEQLASHVGELRRRLLSNDQWATSHYDDETKLLKGADKPLQLTYHNKIEEID